MKRLTASLLALLLVSSLTACGQRADPGGSIGDEPTVPVTQPQPAPPEQPQPDPPEQPLRLTGDSFWWAGPDEEGVQLDLTLWADGRARIREFRHGGLINDDMELRLTWEQTEDAALHLYSRYSAEEPLWTGTVTRDAITLLRCGSAVSLLRETMPESVGMRYAPAELRGVWLMVGSEVEGCVEPAMPGRFQSLVFQTEWVGEERSLLASSETGNESGFIMGGAVDTFCHRPITVLDQSLYGGCGNEEWSVRIGDASPLGEDGYPTQVELYATLLDQDTLLLQRYFTFDGGPGVSYQTFRCIMPDRGWMDSVELGDSSWRCVGFTAADGTGHTLPPGVGGFALRMEADGTFSFSKGLDAPTGTGSGGEGQWKMGEGGTLLLSGENFPDDWFAGAVRSVNDVPELFLCYDGGVMELERVEDDGEEFDIELSLNSLSMDM